MNPVVHFEMPYADRERMAEFYGSAFGWQTQMLGEDMGNYVVTTTTETDEGGPKTPGRINGGFFPRRADWPAQHPSVVIAVDDIEESMGKVAKAGGQVLGEPMAIPGVGQVLGEPMAIPGVGQYVLVHRHRGQPREYAPATPARHTIPPRRTLIPRFTGSPSGAFVEAPL